MPYVFVTTEIRLVRGKIDFQVVNFSIQLCAHHLFSPYIFQESGPTRVGDADSDPELMEYLQAKLVSERGNNL